MMFKRISLIALLMSVTMMQPSDIKKETHFIETSNAKIYYELFYTDASKDRTPIIGMHGGPGSTHHYLLALAELAVDRPVILYDQSGSYKSTMKDPNFSDWNLDHFVTELKEFIDALGYEKVHLLGHSWGGMLAVKYALQFPETIVQLILAGPCLSSQMWVDDCKKLAQSLSSQSYETMVKHEAAGTTDNSEYGAAAKEFYDNFYCRVIPHPENAQISGNLLNRTIYCMMWGPYEMTCFGNLKDVDLVPELYKLQMPVLIICGQYDTATPESMQLCASKIPIAQLVVIPDCAHQFPTEKPEEFLTVIRSFIPRSEKYRTFQQNKLWRDKIVSLLEQNGSKITWECLNDEAFARELKIKFMEEAAEVCSAESKEALIEEFADVLEVMTAWCLLYGYSLQDVIVMQQHKFEKRGGFQGRKFVTIAAHPEGSFGEKYCLAQPIKYPEVKE